MLNEEARDPALPDECSCCPTGFCEVCHRSSKILEPLFPYLENREVGLGSTKSSCPSTLLIIQLLSRVWLFVTPWTAALLHYFLQFTQTRVHWVGDAIQPSHPLLPSFPFAFHLSQHQGRFLWVGSLHQVVKVLAYLGVNIYPRIPLCEMLLQWRWHGAWKSEGIKPPPDEWIHSYRVGCWRLGLVFSILAAH